MVRILKGCLSALFGSTRIIAADLLICRWSDLPLLAIRVLGGAL